MLWKQTLYDLFSVISHLITASDCQHFHRPPLQALAQNLLVRVYSVTILVLLNYILTLILYLLETERVREGKECNLGFIVREEMREGDKEGPAFIEIVVFDVSSYSLPVLLRVWEDSIDRFQAHFVETALVIHVPH